MIIIHTAEAPPSCRASRRRARRSSCRCHGASRQARPRPGTRRQRLPMRRERIKRPDRIHERQRGRTSDEGVQLRDLVQRLHQSGQAVDEQVDTLADRLHRIALVHRLRRGRVALRRRHVRLCDSDHSAWTRHMSSAREHETSRRRGGGRCVPVAFRTFSDFEPLYFCTPWSASPIA